MTGSGFVLGPTITMEPRVLIAAASAVIAIAALPVETIQSRFGDLPAGMPAPSLPHVSVERISDLLPSAA